MAPTLLPGDRCLVVKPRGWHRGDVVVLEHPQRPGHEVVKRLIALPGDLVGGRRLRTEEHWALGDHAEGSTDSRDFGPISEDALKARVLLIYGPRDRRRLLGS